MMKVGLEDQTARPIFQRDDSFAIPESNNHFHLIPLQLIEGLSYLKHRKCIEK